MNDQLFRKKSMEKITSPENLNDYIRVASPGVWMTLCAVILILIGVCCWGVFGRLDTTVRTAAVPDGTRTVCYISEENIASVEEGMTVTIDDTDYRITALSSEPRHMTGWNGRNRNGRCLRSDAEGQYLHDNGKS